jgi:uncharacterized membrane protein YcaP (DUF421 family)
MQSRGLDQGNRKRMKPEDINLGDWSRIILGEAPAAFLLEAVLRLVVMYLLLILSMRFLGKKMASQLTRDETAAMVSLAAAIGVPVLAPDRGLLSAFVIALVVVTGMRIIFSALARKPQIEKVVLGKFETLISDGVMNIAALQSTGIPRERLLAQLRSRETMHLGEIKRLYLEANGRFTVVKATEPKPGLSAIPDIDAEFAGCQRHIAAKVCHYCGQSKDRLADHEDCPNCHQNDWIDAVS